MDTDMFTRQVSLFGKKAQSQIAACKVGIVGLGGLGSAVAHLLCRMGVQHFVLVDFDSVAIHNLSRQHLYTREDVGVKKTLAATKHLSSINPNITINSFDIKIETVADLNCFQGMDIVVDGLDNHSTRRLLDLFCKNQNIPWVHGAAIQEKGAVFFFDQNTKYENIYALDASDTHCDISGVLASATTAVANIQAQLVINFILKRIIPKEFIHIDMSTLSFDKYVKK